MNELVQQLTEPFLKISDDIAFNGTLGVQLVLFLVLYFVLKPLLWKPTLEVLDRRKALTTGRKEQAEAGNAEIAKLEAEYLDKLRAARNGANEERNKIRATAMAASKEQVEGAKNEAAKTIAAIRAEVAKAVTGARTQLKGEAEAAAAVMTAKILGRS